MSGLSTKKRSARVLTIGSVGGGLTQKVKKPLSGVKLSSADKNLKDGGPVSVDRQLTSMDTDGEASDGKATSNSQMNTPNAKHFNTGAAISSLLSSINYDMDDEEEVSLPPRLFFSLEKVWVDPKIVKTQVEVAVKKSFTLDINLSAVEEKLAMAKTQVIRKLFSSINGFGGATTPLKFEKIIRSMFTLPESMEKAMSLARENNIIVNSNLKRQGICSDQAIVIKEIPMDMPKEMIVTTVFKFGKIKSIKIQLIGLWQKAVVKFAELEQAVSLAARWSFLIGKDSVHVTMAVGNCETWVSRDQFRALLFTLPVRTTAYDLGDFLEGAGGKTCVINWSLETGNRVCCAVVCFDSDEILESAFCTELILGGVKLSWARLNLVRCERCGKFSHSALECNAEVVSVFKSSKFFIRPTNPDTRLQLAKLYVKKNVLISRPVAFGDKFWAQVVSVASVSHGFHAGSGSGSPLSGDLSSGGVLPPLPVVNFSMSTRLVLLECSVELLFKQILNILSCLDNISSAPLAPSSQLAPSVIVSQSPTSVPLVVANPNLDFDMAVDDSFVQPTSFSPGVTSSLLGLSSSKVLTSKVGGLESKLVALDISVGSILAKLNQLCAGLGSSVISSSQ
ncbi:hypothetical protein G9A89_015569 [Geosiphon pyriformis]|nr:hypothetical protein G9A89_015569 [Geosiphon pyriformis]